MMQPPVLSVKQLNGYVKSLLENDKNLAVVYLKGEISNFKNHYQSGHLYLSLKDSDAVIKAVMFRFAAAHLRFEPCDGMSVICRGRVSLYERDGSYQFYIDEMIPDGVGDLTVAFEQIKERLAKEGYFDAAHKKPIPSFPRNIAVITSDTGAAVQDILNVLSRRFPICNVIMCPVHVQGEHTVPDIIDALNRVQKFDDIDTVIVGRGGGSIEDLWAFNDERLAKAVFECKIPVISAVGHETDFTICDFVADLRAPTPSAAAELAVPDINELRQTCDSFYERLKSAEKKFIDMHEMRINWLSNKYSFASGERLLDNCLARQERMNEKLIGAFSSALEKRDGDFRRLVAKLDTLSPLNVLSRGYCVADKDGKVLKSTDDIKIHDVLNLKLHSGSARCSVLSIEEKE